MVVELINQMYATKLLTAMALLKAKKKKKKIHLLSLGAIICYYL